MKVTWTAEELRDFERLIGEQQSEDKLMRITANICMNGFTEKHGAEKCEAMRIHLETRDLL